MAKRKKKKFAELNGLTNTLQPSRDQLKEGLPWSGRWREEVFEQDGPLILELGCGRGEYTVDMARSNPAQLYVGVDIKGARIVQGARIARDEDLQGVRFLRSQIEWIDRAFGPAEVDEIWITFPDPQIKYRRAAQRLTHPSFFDRYRKILKPGGLVHLKTDSEFLYGYTSGLLEQGQGQIQKSYADVYAVHQRDEVLNIRTYYERKWLAEGKPITYLQFTIH